MKRKKGKKILVVDDDKEPRLLLSEMLEDEGYDVTTAKDGKEAFKLLRRSSSDLVTTCIMMPNMDGLTLLRKIKEISPDTPVLIISAIASSREIAEKAIKDGASDCLSKPVTANELKGAVRKALKRRY